MHSHKKVSIRIYEGEVDNIKCVFISPLYLNLILYKKDFVRWSMLIFKVNLFPTSAE